MTNILNSLSREKIGGGVKIGNIFSSYVGTNIDIAKMQKDREF